MGDGRLCAGVIKGVDAEGVRADAARVEPVAEPDVTVTHDDRPAERAGEAAPARLNLLSLIEPLALGGAHELDLRPGRIGGRRRRCENEYA